MHPIYLCLYVLLAITVSSTVSAERAQGDAVPDLLDAYDAGQYEHSVRAGASWPDLDDLRKTFPRAARTWIDRVPEQTARRRLVAAGWILEVTRERYERDWWAWSTLQDTIEWACGELRRERNISPGEQAWHRASVALAGRATDWVWLAAVDSPRATAGMRRRVPLSRKANHVVHAWQRFPADPYFWVAKAIALSDQLDADSDVSDRANRVTGGTSFRGTLMSTTTYGLTSAQRDSRKAIEEFAPVMGAAEFGALAQSHVAHLYLMLHDHSAALEHAITAARSARDPQSRYLGLVFAGMALEGLGRTSDARTAYGEALKAIPSGQTAVLHLSALNALDSPPRYVTLDLARAAAGPLLDDDPVRLYQYGTYLYWPMLIERLHETLR